MKKGVLIFAHNNGDIDYLSTAILSAKLAKKYLKVPVSLITDNRTVNENYDLTELNKTFENIIYIDPPKENNNRILHNGPSQKSVKFLNSTRSTVWNLTPYERTLLIDSDFLIFSDNLSKYWDVEEDLLISDAYNDIIGDERIGYYDRYVSNTGVKMYWATTVMFSKTEKTKMFFDLVEYIKNNYEDMAYLYRFSPNQYRNDISFSIAKHIFDGFETPNTVSLPPILTTIGKDMLFKINNTSLTFLLNLKADENTLITTIRDTDVHVINKQSIIDNFDKLMEVACLDI